MCFVLVVGWHLNIIKSHDVLLKFLSLGLRLFNSKVHHSEWWSTAAVSQGHCYFFLYMYPISDHQLKKDRHIVGMSCGDMVVDMEWRIKTMGQKT